MLSRLCSLNVSALSMGCVLLLLLAQHRAPYRARSATSVPTRSGRLVVHVGAHKTGTSTIQAFMKYHRQWIEDTFPPLYVPRGKWKHRVPPQVNFSDTDSIDTNMTKALMSNATVLLSNEGFVLKNGSDLRALVKRFAPLCLEMVAVFIHRPMLEWLQSSWSDNVLYSQRHGLGEPFSGFLLREDGPLAVRYLIGSGTLSPALRPRVLAGYDMYVEIFGEAHVRVASLARLREDKQSPASYLICSVSLQLQGKGLRLCEGILAEKMAATMPDANVSPPPGVLDVIRLARLVQHADCGQNTTMGRLVLKLALFSKANVTALQRTAMEIAAAMPMVCDDERLSALGAMARAFDAAFYERSGILRPRQQLPMPAICHVDETELTSQHFEQLRSVYRAGGGCRQ